MAHPATAAKRTLATNAAPRRASEPSAVNTIPRDSVESRAGLRRRLLLGLLLGLLLLLLLLLLLQAPLVEGMSRSDSGWLLLDGFGTSQEPTPPCACLWSMMICGGMR